MISLNGHSDRMKKLLKLPEPKVIISLEVQSDRNEKKYFFSSHKNQDKISYICKGNKIFMHTGCQTKTVSSMITKEIWARQKLGKICNNMFKLNQNLSLEP